MEDRCREVATYGINRAIHCVMHTVEGETSLVGEECASCHLVDVLNTENLCVSCDPTTIRRARLAKQREVKLWLDYGGHDDYVLYDRVLERSCGKERPDFTFDCGTHFVLLEVDEDQHDGRPEECECARMVNLSQAAGLPTVFLRYNPDPWRVDGRKRDWSLRKRRDLLLRWLDHLKKSVPTSFLSVVRLFFDSFTDEAVRLSLID